MQILALSSSRVGEGAYLEQASLLIRDFLPLRKARIAFLPFAGVDPDHAAYAALVREGLAQEAWSLEVMGPSNGRELLAVADAVMVGGGNTFKLLHDLCKFDLLEPIRQRVRQGLPYIGWSAGANLTGRSIATTNDMPIIQPAQFAALQFFPFQINPHYVNIVAPGFHGETRDQRLGEFVRLNPGIPVVALPEGTALLYQAAVLRFVGTASGVLFRGDAGGNPSKSIIEPGSDLSLLMTAAG